MNNYPTKLSLIIHNNIRNFILFQIAPDFDRRRNLE